MVRDRMTLLAISGRHEVKLLVPGTFRAANQLFHENYGK